MLVKKNTYTGKAAQNGSLLIESLVIVAILAILAVIAVPNVSNLLLRKDINTARETLVQSLKLARQQAQAENTMVNVALKGREISIRTGNGQQAAQRILLPERVQMVAAANTEDKDQELTVTFNPNGTVNTNNATVLAVVIRSAQNPAAGVTESVQINSLGNIAGI